MSRTLAAKRRELGRLNKDIKGLEESVEAVRGVEDFNGFPVRVTPIEGSDTYEIYPADARASRFATVVADASNGWRATAHFTDDDGKPLATGCSKASAMRTAKAFVATGKIEAPK